MKNKIIKNTAKTNEAKESKLGVFIIPKFLKNIFPYKNMKTPACCLSDWSHLFKMKMASFLAGTMEGAEEKEKKVPAMPEILKKKQKNFTDLKIKCWEIICLKDALKGKKFIYEKAKPYHKEDKQIYRTEIQMARMARKASNFYVPTEPKLALVIRNRGIRDLKGVATLPLSDVQWHLLKLNKVSINMLRRVEPYIACGLVAKLCPTLATPWTVACQAPLSMGFSRQEYIAWSYPNLKSVS